MDHKSKGLPSFEQRQDERFLVKDTVKAGIDVHCEPPYCLEGVLHDISLSGARIIISGDATRQIRTSNVYENDHLFLLTPESVKLPIIMRWFKYQKSQHQTHVGLEFVRMTDELKKTIMTLMEQICDIGLRQ